VGFTWRTSPRGKSKRSPGDDEEARGPTSEDEKIKDHTEI